MPTQRPFTPIGSFTTRKLADDAAKTLTIQTGNRWISCKSGRHVSNFGKRAILEGFAIVRKDAA